MVENAHNCIANEIIAHNTYISDNVSLADNLTVGGDKFFVDASSGRISIRTASLTHKLNVFAASLLNVTRGGGVAGIEVDNSGSVVIRLG